MSACVPVATASRSFAGLRSPEAASANLALSVVAQRKGNSRLKSPMPKIPRMRKMIRQGFGDLVSTTPQSSRLSSLLMEWCQLMHPPRPRFAIYPRKPQQRLK
jgi:hypothetical protein